jgi:hypothetical protein
MVKPFNLEQTAQSEYRELEVAFRWRSVLLALEHEQIILKLVLVEFSGQALKVQRNGSNVPAVVGNGALASTGDAHLALEAPVQQIKALHALDGHIQNRCRRTRVCE